MAGTSPAMTENDMEIRDWGRAIAHRAIQPGAREGRPTWLNRRGALRTSPMSSGASGLLK